MTVAAARPTVAGDERMEAGMRVATAMRDKLTAAFAPVRLEIEDDSHRHAGHAGAPAGGESHFNVLMVAAAFAGQSRVARQRAVYAVLRDELAGPVHALSLTLRTPEEEASRGG